MSEYEKDFAGWNRLKIKIDNSNRIPTFKEREVWWANIGFNIGYEVDGKNEFCSRPILILKKFNRRIFWGIPLTTQIKDIPFYHHFEFKGKKQCAILPQMRLFDGKRLSDKMGKITPSDFEKIKNAVKSIT